MITHSARPTFCWTGLENHRIARHQPPHSRRGVFLAAVAIVAALITTAAWAQERKSRPTQPRTAERRTEGSESEGRRAPQARDNRPAGDVQRVRNDRQPPIGPQPAVPRQPLPPPFIPLPEKEEQFIDNLLTWWESQSKKIKRYRCDFVKREYDTVTGPAVSQDGRLHPKTISYGKIRYMAPDKGMFKVEQVTHYQPPKKLGGEPEYVELPNAPLDHWVCSGESIFTYNYSEKELLEMHLPEHLRGSGIVEGPLPFLFGADAKRVKDRYWLHVITTQEAAKLGEYWLEAFPKRQEDAATFKMVHVIFDKEYLPRAIKLFPVNFNADRNQSSTLFVFDDREVNFLLESLNPFQNSFYEPEPPGRGWKKRTIDYVDGAPAPAAEARVPRVEKRR